VQALPVGVHLEQRSLHALAVLLLLSQADWSNAALPSSEHEHVLIKRKPTTSWSATVHKAVQLAAATASCPSKVPAGAVWSQC
jgi:hypothetical protein